ncbi:MAG: GTPase [Mycoplasmoidaceae bacterium]
MKYNRKCIGCGNYLSSDKNDISYVKEFNDDMKYCIRCFQLKHYGKIREENHDSLIFKRLKEIDFKDHFIIMILDLFDLENSIIKDVDLANNDVLIVVNKLAALPKKFRYEITKKNIDKILLKNNIHYIDIIIYDAIEKIHLRKIMDYIENATEHQQKIYFIGKTNVGKSSLINSLMEINKQKSKLLTNPTKNTTLDLQKIKLRKSQLIDTPGYLNDHSIINNISNKDILNISKHKFNTSIFKIIDDQQLLFIEKLFGIAINDISEKINPSIVFYKSSNLKILRMKKTKRENFLNSDNQHIEYKHQLFFEENKFELDENKKYSIFASGVALIVIKGIKNISIIAPKEISYSIIKNSII